MIITKDKVKEIDIFYELFLNRVDDVTLKNFTGRGNHIDKLISEEQQKIVNYVMKRELYFQKTIHTKLYGEKNSRKIKLIRVL
jgi:hypothetical protein